MPRLPFKLISKLFPSSVPSLPASVPESEPAPPAPLSPDEPPPP